MVASVEDLIMEEATDVQNDRTVRQCCGVVLSTCIISCEFCGFWNSEALDSVFLGYEIASMGNWTPKAMLCAYLEGTLYPRSILHHCCITL